MIRFTVTWTKPAQADLALKWIHSQNRQDLTNFANRVDRELATDAHLKGVPLIAGLLDFSEGALSVAYTVSLDDRLVTVWGIKEL